MQTNSRIASIIKTNNLEFSVTAVPSFDLAVLNLRDDLEFELPTNLRLGHLAEKIVSELIKNSTNYNLVYENIQIIEDKKTIGELDFIIENEVTRDLIHVELAYKFYLFDPTLSLEPINNWIGPNRNDSLQQKLTKLKTKQFPLLHYDCTASQLYNLDIKTVSQALCLLVSLFVPYDFKQNLPPVYQKAIKGYYLDFDTFISLDSTDKFYFLPSKTDWGIDPADNEMWIKINSIEKSIRINMYEKRSLLCWQKQKNSYAVFFIVWW
ncbi:DUF1853 family protein [Flavobacterium sp. 7A]|uniref:DUF1853 family protein n=1 Tax=Flavobacterium sp. 7A TaxID=2940571 RepID=UPI002226D6E7|nr:DUF1853 family protein [Flavobacterium sp. 7A]MCW2120817.1 hypothetical protein [Flavobacterium sp. 7A]